MGTFLVMAVIVSMILIPSVMANTDPETVLVNINTADTDELTSLPGVGVSKATAIINYRTEHGLFTTVDELSNVRGIGESILDKIRDLVRTK
jgi:competence protein ComEA